MDVKTDSAGFFSPEDNPGLCKIAVPEGIDPVMTLSFAALCVIPALKLNTRGLFDVTKFSFVPVDAGV